MAAFYGLPDMEKISLPEKRILKAGKAQAGGLRDWQAITPWAAATAEAPKKEN